MRRLLMLLAGGAFLSLTAAAEPPAPPATAEEAASDAATAAAAATTEPTTAPAAESQGLVFAGEEGAASESAAEAAAALTQPGPATPYARDLAAARLQYRQRLAELTAAFQAERDAVRSIALQREIQQLKLDTEIGYLEIQGRHARALGRTQLADEADALVQQLRRQLPRSGDAAPSTPQSDAARGAQH